MEAAAIQISADDREMGCPVIEELRRMAGVTVRIAHLTLGDYRVGDALLVERKTLVDFAASVRDGRLFSQAVRLAGAPVQPVIILEGTAADLGASGMRREALQGALISVSIVLGIPVLRACNPNETARLMVYAARQIGRCATGAHYRHAYRPKGKLKRQLFILQGLPGVGPQRAQRLLEKFGSVEAVFTADEHELGLASGIGATTAEAIRWAARETGRAYATNAQRRKRGRTREVSGRASHAG